MPTKQQAKEKIAKLIQRYENLSDQERDHYNEQATKQHFIQPFFEAFGWNFQQDVWPEEKASNGRVDYAFKIGNITKFFVETKKIPEDLERPEHAKQTIDYAWNKAVTWAVLTDFEGLKIFNSEWKGKFYWPVKEFKYNEYLTRFDELWYLSRESIAVGELDARAVEWGVREKRVPVGEQLAEDLANWRQTLKNDFSAWNKGKYTESEITEAVQRFLDRLVFTRFTEDKKFEDPILLPTLRAWKSGKHKTNLTQELNQVFRKYDEWYDSKLFEPHFSETLETYGPLEDIIEDLYQPRRGGSAYDFSVIDADVLGSIYEQYLGELQQQEAGKEKSKRKQHGIYYTPTFVVNYILKHTLGKVLEDKSSSEIRKLKILDPACGSGSFLIKAYQLLADHLAKEQKTGQYEKGSKLDALEKIMQARQINTLTASERFDILRNNIYGVDLDTQAAEIAQLNLLLQAAVKRTKLPQLQHIKVGNSLISGTEKELKKYYGAQWKDKKPFNWEDQFSEVFKDGGFDIVIGNPPWGADIDADIAYLEARYPNSTKQHKDIYKIFIDHGLSLLKPGGILGFIVPNTFLFQPRYKDIRLLLKQYKILQIVNLGEKVFSGVEAPSCIIIAQKSKPGKHFVQVIDLADSKDNIYKIKALAEIKPTLIDQSLYEKTVDNNFVISYHEFKSDEKELGDILDCRDAGFKYQRVGVGLQEKGKSDLAKRIFYDGEQKHLEDIPILIGSDLSRDGYFIDLQSGHYLRHNFKELLHDNEIVFFNSEFFDAKEKITWRQTSDRIRAAIVGPYWFGNTIQSGVLRDEWKGKIDLYYLLALLNSKYLNNIYIQNVRETGRVFPQVKIGKIKMLPIKIISMSKQKPFIDLAKKMIDLNKKLRAATEDSDDSREIKLEIKKTDELINQKVFELYGLKG